MNTKVTDPVLLGRKAVDKYRVAHAALYAADAKRKTIPAEHTPLLNAMLATLKRQGFDTIQEFFEASMALNEQIFKECYVVEGECCHECHGRMRGCLENWYQERMTVTQNETLEPLVTIEEVYKATFLNAAPKYLPPACTFKILKVGNPVNWTWS